MGNLLFFLLVLLLLFSTTDIGMRLKLNVRPQKEKQDTTVELNSWLMSLYGAFFFSLYHVAAHINIQTQV